MKILICLISFTIKLEKQCFYGGAGDEKQDADKNDGGSRRHVEYIAGIESGETL